MAAGGGRATSNPLTALSAGRDGGHFKENGNGTAPRLEVGNLGGDLASRTQQALRINTSFGNLGSGMRRGGPGDEDDDEILSAASSLEGSDMSATGSESASARSSAAGSKAGLGSGTEIWRGDVSAVIGLQKRGLRGLMEGRRLRERGASVGTSTGTGSGRVGLGIKG